MTGRRDTVYMSRDTYTVTSFVLESGFSWRPHYLPSSFSCPVSRYSFFPGVFLWSSHDTLTSPPRCGRNPLLPSKKFQDPLSLTDSSLPVPETRHLLLNVSGVQLSCTVQTPSHSLYHLGSTSYVPPTHPSLTKVSPERGMVP